MTTSACEGATARSGGAVGIGRAAIGGAIAGTLASLMMAGYVMVAALAYQGRGFFTPLYHIASTVSSGQAMMQSMEAAMAGHSFTLLAGPALLGTVIHVAVGAGYGVTFAVIARLLRVHGARMIGAALVWGVVVFVVSAWIGLPVAASLFGGGSPISDMASMVGYPTFLVEHLIYGAVLGIGLTGVRTGSPQR